jgi:hypothetical protein
LAQKEIHIKINIAQYLIINNKKNEERQESTYSVSELANGHTKKVKKKRIANG